MLNKSFITMLVLGFISMATYGQLPQKALEIPIKYNTPEEGVSLSKGDIGKPGSWWVVYSDKKGNETYENATGNKVKRVIGFLDDFYVAEETDKRAHLVKDPNYAEGFSSSAEDYGWIDKENLLLWDHCLITKTGKINKKGMVLNTIESLKKEKISAEDEEKVKYFYDSQLTQPTTQSSQIYEILYIYRIKDDAILLGKASRTDVFHAKDDIFGWVSAKKITIWDHRIAIEPNWDKEAALERKRKHISTTFFIDVPKAKRFADGKELSKKYIIWNNDTYEKRNIGDWRRFPLLDFDKSTNIIKAGVMGELRSVMNNQDTISQIGFADILRKYNELRAKQRNINIVFVVDGTSSMQPYFPALSKAIGESMDKLQKSFTKNSLRFGVVVYRDYAEKDMITQVHKLTSNYQNVSHWLGGIKAIDRFDKDKPEAVFYGLMTALRSVGLQQNETNVIILVGDAANHHRNDPSQVNKNDLINLLSRYDCNMLAFQVNKGSDPTYNEFEPQMKDLILSTALRKYKQNKQIAEQTNLKLSPPKFVASRKNVFSLDTTTMIGAVVLASRGNPLPPQVLKNEINKVVLFSSTLTDRKLKILESFISEGQSFENAVSKETEGQSDETEDYSSDVVGAKSSYTPAIIDFLRKMGIPEEKLKIILSENYQLYFPAYSTMYVQGLKFPLYKEVLFMTQLELGDLLNKFDALADAYTASSQRQRLKEVWLEILKSHLGDDLTKEEAENMTFEKINEKVFGLPGTSNLLHIKLGSITDESVVSDAEFYKYIINVKNKRNELNKIYNKRNYEYGFYSYDTHYFWIPQDLLP